MVLTQIDQGTAVEERMFEYARLCSLHTYTELERLSRVTLNLPREQTTSSGEICLAQRSIS